MIFVGVFSKMLILVFKCLVAGLSWEAVRRPIDVEITRKGRICSRIVVAPLHTPFSQHKRDWGEKLYLQWLRF